jgi:tRNA threonylcarbamoyladenosine biosynthesis protein TsaB
VALSKDGSLLDHKTHREDRFSHAEKLAIFIDDLLKENKLSTDDLSAVAISQGPGSYTGLRIGTAMAKGIAFAKNIPLIAIDTCQLPVFGLDEIPPLAISLLSARQNEVYYAVYKNGEREGDILIEELSEHSFKVFANKEITFCGNGLIHLQENTTLYPSWNLVEQENPYHSKHMIPLAYKKYLEKEFVDLAYFEPYYLKDFIVQTKKNSKTH